jgi:hypothetical protein
LLTAEEQVVLPRLALFRGGFRRQAAGQVAGAPEAIRAAIGTALAVGECERHEWGMTAVQQQLGEAATEVAWRAGQQLSDEAAVAYALAVIEG